MQSLKPLEESKSLVSLDASGNMITDVTCAVQETLAKLKVLSRLDVRLDQRSTQLPNE